MSKNLILEIGTEELPAGFISAASSSMKDMLKMMLSEYSLEFESIKSYGTPCRLVAVVDGLAERQGDTVVETIGPPAERAFDSNGKPTKAVTGFARKQGMSIKDLELKKTSRGQYLLAKKKVKGRRTRDILREIIPSVITGISFPKTMRWGDGNMAFARPIHWILLLYGDDCIHCKVGNIRSGRVTRGHRFLAAGSIRVDSADAYLKRVRNSFVILDQGERRDMIKSGMKKLVERINGRYIEDPYLLDEVSNMVEWPVVLMGGFETSFLDLPDDVIINTMREHQRYFAVEDLKGQLMPYFITIANIKVNKPEVIIKGNERVLRARLNDAKFYFEKDAALPLKKRVDALKGVIFHDLLGTSYEKVERFTRLAIFIGSTIGLCDDMKEDERPADFLNEHLNPIRLKTREVKPGLLSRAIIGRAAMLCKADLVSDMVGEFPKLQGIMGSIYARQSGEAPEVSTAIYEHYFPTSASGKLPQSPYGAIISIADKLDTICGCFSVGLIPTGESDPYALRRQALGIIVIILNKGVKTSLDIIVGRSLELLQDVPGNQHRDPGRDILDFFRERLRHLLLQEGYSFDTVDAVLSTSWYDVKDAVARVKAINAFRENPECKNLVTAFKRVSNILKGSDLKYERPDPSLFEEPSEVELYRLFEAIAPVIERHWLNGHYEGVFETLLSMKDKIDLFFDSVMVMVEDERIRSNRLKLLHSVQGLYSRIADLSRLAM